MVEPASITVEIPLEHSHPEIAERLDAIGGVVADEVETRKSEDAILADRVTKAQRLADELDLRVRALEDRPVIVPGPAPFAPDFHVRPDGSDTADGLTRATAWRSAAKAPAGKVTALWDGGVIAGGAIYDRDVHLVTAPGVHAVLRGSGQYSLRLQRAHGSTIHPGAGGSITTIAAADAVEPTVDGEKPGTSRRACVQLTDCNDLDLELRVVAGTDFGILTGGLLRRCRVVADVSDAGHGFMLKGDLGSGADRSWFGGRAHDCNRMIRNLRNPGSNQGAYGAVGFVWENSTGGGLLAGWLAERNHAPCFQYGFDGGAIEGYDSTDVVVEEGTGIDCEGGFETGGSSGRGMHNWRVSGLKIRGDISRNGKSPGVLIRNFEGSTLDFDIDVVSGRVLLEVDGTQASGFGGSIANSRIRGTYVDRGIQASSLRAVPASTVVSMVPR